MKRFIALTFLLMGWGYYELSGGAAFVPQQRDAVLAESETSAPSEAVELGGIEIVTRSDVALVSLTEPENPVAAAPAVPADDIAAVVETLAPEPSPVVEAAAPVSLQADLREVTGDRVNLREGPGRDFAAVDQLALGTVIEVMATGDDSWVQIEVIATGQTGWMSADFLISIDG